MNGPEAADEMRLLVLFVMGPGLETSWQTSSRSKWQQRNCANIYNGASQHIKETGKEASSKFFAFVVVVVVSFDLSKENKAS